MYQVMPMNRIMNVSTISGDTRVGYIFYPFKSIYLIIKSTYVLRCTGPSCIYCVDSSRSFELDRLNEFCSAH